jgi:cytochrome c-type biogenesis protein CcmH/NrfG
MVQWAVAYVATPFALLQGINVVAQQFGWPEAVWRGITLALIVGFFVTLVLAWYHGERGAQKPAWVTFPRAFCEGLAAPVRNDPDAARSAFAAARTELERVTREQPQFASPLAVLGKADAALGRKDEAIAEGRRALELCPPSKDAIVGADMMEYLAVIYAWTGEKDLALEQLAATVKIPGVSNYGELCLHPFWDSLSGDPRFEKIVASLGPKGAK